MSYFLNIPPWNHLRHRHPRKQAQLRSKLPGTWCTGRPLLLESQIPERSGMRWLTNSHGGPERALLVPFALKDPFLGSSGVEIRCSDDECGIYREVANTEHEERSRWRLFGQYTHSVSQPDIVVDRQGRLDADNFPRWVCLNAKVAIAQSMAAAVPVQRACDSSFR